MPARPSRLRGGRAADAELRQWSPGGVPLPAAAGAHHELTVLRTHRTRAGNPSRRHHRAAMEPVRPHPRRTRNRLGRATRLLTEPACRHDPPASLFGANLPLWKAHGHAAVMSGLVDVTHHASLVNVVWVRARCDLHQDAPNRVTVGDLAGQTRDHLVGRSHLCSGAVEHCVDRTSSEPVWPRGSASQAARPSESSSNSASGCVGAFSRPAAASEGHDDAHVDCGNGPLIDRRHRTAAATVVAEEGGNQPLVE
jgi:hypothetical protein